MALLPSHNRIDCNVCFENKSIQWGKSEREVNGWKIEANAGAWGSRNPKILVLGVSKGPNQTKGILNMRHEDIPFKDERPYLTKYLRRLGFLKDHEIVDSKISAKETVFAFGSIIRCGIGLWSEEKKEYIKVGNVVNSAATHPQAQEFVANCTRKHLEKLPINLSSTLAISGCRSHLIEQAFKELGRN